MDNLVDKVRHRMSEASREERKKALAASEVAMHANLEVREAREELEEAKQQLKSLLSERSSAWDHERERLRRVAEEADNRVLELEKEAEWQRNEGGRLVQVDEDVTRAMSELGAMESELRQRNNQVPAMIFESKNQHS